MLLKTAIRDENPVIFVENLALYNVRGDVPDGEDRVPVQGERARRRVRRQADVERDPGPGEAADERRVAGARMRLGASHGGDPVFQRRTDRRLGQGSTYQLREREAGMLVDPAGSLPGLAGA